MHEKFKKMGRSCFWRAAVSVVFWRCCIATVNTEDYIFQRSLSSAVFSGQPAERWNVTQKRTGETSELFFHDSDKLVCQGEEYRYQFSGDMLTAGYRLEKADGTQTQAVSAGGLTLGSMEQWESFDQIGLINSALLIRSGLYFLRPSFLLRVVFALLFAVAGAVLIALPTWDLRPGHETDRTLNAVSRCAAAGVALIGIALLILALL